MTFSMDQELILIYLEVKAASVAHRSSSGVSSPKAGQHISEMVIIMTTKFNLIYKTKNIKIKI